MIRFNSASATEKPNAFCLNKTFFSIIAAVAEKNAEVNARLYHGIIFLFYLF